MSAQRQKPIDFAAEGLCLAFLSNRNCGIGLALAWAIIAQGDPTNGLFSIYF